MEFFTSPYFQLLLFGGAGLFTIAGAIFNWDWFMNDYRARFFVKIFGRDGARIFYVILGLVIIVLGVFVAYQ
jgi:hypothetical protein